MTEVYHFSRSIVARFPANLLPNRTRVRRPRWLHKQTPNKKNIKVALTFTNKSKTCFCCYSVIGSFVFISREYLMRDNGLAGPRNTIERSKLSTGINGRYNGLAGPRNTIERSKMPTEECSGIWAHAHMLIF